MTAQFSKYLLFSLAGFVAVAGTAVEDDRPKPIPLGYSPQPVPVRYLATAPGRHPVAVFKMLVERSNFGDNVEIAELIQEHGLVPPHVHQSDEIFHVLEGELIITVQRPGDMTTPKQYCLKPGMTGVVKKGDLTTHRVVTPVMRAMVTWAPGGEADHMIRRAGFQSLPYHPDRPNPFHELLETPAVKSP